MLRDYALAISVAFAGITIAGAVMVTVRTQTISIPPRYIERDLWTGTTAFCEINIQYLSLKQWAETKAGDLSRAGFKPEEISDYFAKPIARENGPTYCVTVMR